MAKENKLAVVIGRMEPPHLGHLEIISKAYDYADHVLVILGSTLKARDPKNPFTFQERKKLLEDSIPKTEGFRMRGVSYKIASVPDCQLAGPTAWNHRISIAISATLQQLNYKENAQVSILGNFKDSSSDYLIDLLSYMMSNYHLNTDTYPFVMLSNPGITHIDNTIIHATDIRNLLYAGKLAYVKNVVPPNVYDFLLEFSKGSVFLDLVQENHYYQDYPKHWGTGTFHTGDAVFFDSGKILLIRRANLPGKGLYAIPGGFVEAGDTNTGIREMLEETSITFDGIEADISDFIVVDSFDSECKGRSLRGDVRTQVDVIVRAPHLKHKEIAIVHADETDAILLVDATTVAIEAIREMLFEDHFEILEKALSILVNGEEI